MDADLQPIDIRKIALEDFIKDLLDQNLQPICQRIDEARRPEDVFGVEDVVLPPEALLEYLEKEYQGIKAVTDPAVYRHPDDIEAAKEADARLEEFYQRAQALIRAGIYGLSSGPVRTPPASAKSFAVGENSYYVGERLGVGRHCELFEGFLERDGEIRGTVLIKIAKTAADNSFLSREILNLALLHNQPVPQWKHLPYIFDRFQAGSRIGIVQRNFAGISMAQVRECSRYLRGVHRKHMIWMLDRLLSCMGYVHSQGIVHGGLCPNNVWIIPGPHNIIVGGWGHAVQNPAQTGGWIEETSELFSAPEAKERGEIGPWSDIFSIGKLMIWILGGNPAENEIPDEVEEPLRKFLLMMVTERASSRPDNAWQLYEEENRIKDGLWPRQFIPFEL